MLVCRYKYNALSRKVTGGCLAPGNRLDFATARLHSHNSGRTMVLRAGDDTAALLPLVAAGDSQAVHAFVDRYGPLVWGILGRSLTQARAHVVSREVFRQLFADAAVLARDPVPEVVVVASTVHRILASETDRDPVESSAANRPVALCVKSVPELVAVSRSLISLPHEQKRAVELCVLQGMPARQVATKMELDINTVRRYLRRGLQKARSSFGARPADGREAQGANP